MKAFTGRPGLDGLIAARFLRYDPIVYEDSLPVSAAGIFQSKLGTEQQQNYAARSSRAMFETALAPRSAMK